MANGLYPYLEEEKIGDSLSDFQTSKNVFNL